MEPSTNLLELPAVEVLKALRVVRHAMTTSADRPHMNGVLIKTRGDKVNYVTTDGHWMLIVARKLEYEVDDHDIRLTSKTVHRLINELEYIDELRPTFRGSHEDQDALITFDPERKRYSHMLGEIAMNFDRNPEDFVGYQKVASDMNLEKRDRSPVTVGINPELMRKVMDALNDREAVGVTPVNMVVGEGPLSPIFFSRDDDPGVFAIVMPCTTDKAGGFSKDPDFMEAPKLPYALITAT